MTQDILNQVEKKMQTSLEVLQRELGTIRTGRASVSLLDGVVVEYYGTPTSLNQMATISVPESRLITIHPWDPSLIHDIERAILKADLGFNPTNDGKIIRINVPPLTEERRKQLVKHVKKLAEDCKVAIRNVRRDGNEAVKAREKSKEISEDDLHRLLDQIQKITDKFTEKVEELCERKEKEILEV